MKRKSFLHSTKLIYEPKISNMVSVYGAEGYGIFMVLLELLCDNKNRIPAQYFAIAQSMNVSEGKAYVPDPDTPGKLKVAFFLWFYSDYYILELDEVNYNYVLIGSSNNNYLWILSRTPQLPDDVKKMLLYKAERRGYDISRLLWVKQSEE